MKFLFSFICISFMVTATAQSPGLSVTVNMNEKDTIGKKVFIEMKFCTPFQTSATGSWSSPDTSAINFRNLKAGEIKCGKYMHNGEGKEVLSGSKKYDRYNQYEYSNQVFAWEKIIILRISHVSFDSVTAPMYIVMPVKYKSFVTNISFQNVSFIPGSIFYLDETNALYKKGYLDIIADLRNHTTASLFESPLKEWVQ